ncbi:MAG: peptidoglycan-binding protein [Geodermatophilaceae bacterium]|nr:peptidoglycan-binding protein [Geodermatophilaceae bacterium]
MAYRLAASLALLREEVNTRFPGRDKASDGWIGDPAHASRKSDHNPWRKDDRGVGVVRALDVDSGHGTDTSVGRLVADHLVRLARTGHPALGRGAYVISDRRIASATSGWAWRRYGGSNPHISHTHVSVSLDQSDYDSRRPWGLAGAPPPSRPTIRRGSEGPAVRELQQVLNRWYPSLPRLGEDGVFGERTEDRVKHFQRGSGITADGVVGPMTWRGLGFK